MHNHRLERTDPGAGQTDAAGLAVIGTDADTLLGHPGPDIQWVPRPCPMTPGWANPSSRGSFIEVRSTRA